MLSSSPRGRFFALAALTRYHTRYVLKRFNSSRGNIDVVARTRTIVAPGLMDSL